MKYIIITVVSILFLGCNNEVEKMKESPLVSVIKLQSAESLLNFEEAKQYIDIDKVFEKYPESKNPQKEWKKMVTFFYNIGNTKKFTNTFKYYNYTITETLNDSGATVSFTAINQDVQIKEIIYSLNKIDDKWKVVEIKYVN